MQMTNSVLLNNIDHKDLKVITTRSAEYGDCIGSTLTFPTEYEDIQREYPILFRQEPKTGEFQSVVLFGFDGEENLFLTKSGWNAKYIPAVIEKGPFVIGLRKTAKDGEPGVVVNIDLDDPRVNQTEGENIFLEYGGNSSYLERMCGVLRCINDGVQASKPMFTAYQALELLEPVSIEYTLNDGAVHKLEGFHTINTERLSGLNGDQVFHLHQSGFLRAAYLVVASLGNIKKLIEMKNATL